MIARTVEIFEKCGCTTEDTVVLKGGKATVYMSCMCTVQYILYMCIGMYVCLHCVNVCVEGPF